MAIVQAIDTGSTRSALAATMHGTSVGSVAISVESLTHRYGSRVIHDNLSFAVGTGRILGLLGKNGVGKTTLIKILMGFLAPSAGQCRVLGERSHALSPATKQRIGLVFEGHLAYDFLSIAETERFFAAWYPRWRRDVFYDLVDRLDLPRAHRIRHMSEGQRSQVVLATVMAQDPDLLILDDYTMGLDAGYRRLFIDFLVHFARTGGKTVLVTSHVVQDMERLVDDVVILRRDAPPLQMTLDDFMKRFRHYRLPAGAVPRTLPPTNKTLHSVRQELDGALSIFTFAEPATVGKTLAEHGLDATMLVEAPMTLEDAFVGYTGAY